MESGRRPAASYLLKFTLKHPTGSSSIHIFGQTTTHDIHMCYADFLYRTVCLGIAFKRKVEKELKNDEYAAISRGSSELH